MPDGGSISLATSTLEETVFVRIKDTGIGIEAENLSRVFDPFFSTKEIGSGTGLGLSICYGILRRHGGTIEVASAIGKGTEVTIKLPVRKPDEKDTDR
jgi:two-component system NtrC family sensor kinase